MRDNQESLGAWWKKVLEVSYPVRKNEAENRLGEEVNNLLQQIKATNSSIEDFIDTLKNPQGDAIDEQRERVTADLIEIISEAIDERISIMKKMEIPFDNSPQFYVNMERLITSWFIDATDRYFGAVKQLQDECEGENDE
jgi:hypothetical protein